MAVGMTDDLTRIATALEALAAALAPQRPPVADARHGHWFVWSQGRLATAPAPRVSGLSLYKGVDAQRDALLENSRRHAHGLPAHDVLLWGSRGMGKSSLVRAVHGALLTDGEDVALIQVARSDVAGLAGLFAALSGIERRFTVFLDDLAFDGSSAEVHALRALLDGGVEARPEGVRLAVTSNRRHLLPGQMAGADADDPNPRDTRDDHLALADRFGLRLGFHACDQETYLAICAGYAAAYGLAYDPQAALTWAAGRGARSGRVAWQFTVESAGEQGISLPA
jgi:predicted AAA+ superfamily ATPase